MNFGMIPAGSSVFLDANVFVYSFANEPQFGESCTKLLERIEIGELQGYLSTAILSDVAHRLMTLEACATLGWSFTGIARRLRHHPDEIRKLLRFRQALDEIISIGVQVLPVECQHVLGAADLSRQHGLLSGDALIVSMMQSASVDALASNDADFDRIPGLTRYGPV
jgi:predicted nucleic acid-binding protein